MCIPEADLRDFLDQDYRRPNFFIVGAARAGTSSLYEYLARHPQIFMSPHKEPHFFSQVRPNRMQTHLMRPVTDLHEYLSLFQDVGETHIARGEASTSYLWDGDSAGRIKACVPDAKVIVVLRNPILRAYSHYLLDVREGVQRKPFLLALQEDQANPVKEWGVAHLYVELGLYYEQLKRYMARFERHQLYLTTYETFYGDLSTNLRELLIFLDVDPEQIGTVDVDDKHNAYARPRNKWVHLFLGSASLRMSLRKVLPAPVREMLRNSVLQTDGEKLGIDPDASHFLREIYAPDIEKLRQLTGMSLPW